VWLYAVPLAIRGSSWPSHTLGHLLPGGGGVPSIGWREKVAEGRFIVRTLAEVPSRPSRDDPARMWAWV
jgi:hypothetical protein